jgi:hypothetical protein
MPAFPHLTRETAPRFKAALGRVAADARPQWGSMDAPLMMAHVARSLEISMGRVEVAPMGSWATRLPIFRRLVFEWMPWPKGKIKAPKEFLPDAGAFEHERANALRAVDEFVAMLDADPGRIVVSAGFGPVELRYWALINGRHLAWHLEQFGARVDERA